MLRTSALFAFIFVNINGSLFGQMFVSQSNKWLADDCFYAVGQTICSTYQYWFSDTVFIDNLAYLRLQTDNPQPMFEVGGYFREENGIVFVKRDTNEAEMAIYNFNLVPGEEFEIGNADLHFTVKVLSADSVALNSGEKRKRLKIASSLDTNSHTYWFEGIGSELSPMNTLFMFSLDAWISFNCYHRDGVVEWQIGDCDLNTAKDLRATAPSCVVSPNPAKEQLYFTRMDQQLFKEPFIVVTDALGHTVWQTPAHMRNTEQITWQTGSIPVGIYFYMIQDAGRVVQSGRVSIVR